MGPQEHPLLRLLAPIVCEYATMKTLHRLHQALGGDAYFDQWVVGPAGGNDETVLERLAYRRLAPLPSRSAAAAFLWPSRQMLLLDRQGHAWLGGLVLASNIRREDTVWKPLPLRPLRQPQRRFLQVARAGERRWLLLDVRGRVWSVTEDEEEALELRSLGERLGRVRCLAGAISHALFCTAEGEVWEQEWTEE